MNLRTMATIDPIMVESDAQQLANQYLSKTIGRAYRAVNGFYGEGYWYFTGSSDLIFQRKSA